MTKVRGAIIFLLVLCTMSCGEYELLENHRICRRKADSTFKANVKILNAENDSVCTANKDRYYQEALDSLIPTRIAEMKKLINK